VDWRLGGEVASCIAAGLGRLPGYNPVLVALKPPAFDGSPDEFARAGYYHVIDAGESLELQSLLDARAGLMASRPAAWGARDADA